MGSAVFEALARSFQAEGRRIASCRAARAQEVGQRIQALLRDGLMSPGVHEAYFGGMRFQPPASYGRDASLLVAATPHSKSLVVLDLPEGAFEAAIPATYLPDRIRERSEQLLRAILGPLGAAFEPAVLPLKTLAACTGLGAYGRDNVLRVEGMGSYARLDAWWIDAGLGESGWGEPRTLERCSRCNACLRACPNGCFRNGAFLIDASRCLTFLNEGNAAFPDWLGDEIHSAAIGCLRCQDACPENSKHRRAVERRFVLDRQTSQALLEGRPAAMLPAEAAQLVRLLELEGHEERLARNLGALRRARLPQSSA